MRSRRPLAAATALGLVLVAGIAASTVPRSGGVAPVAHASTNLLLGLMDDALFQYRTQDAFVAVEDLRPQVIRYDADWPQVAKRRPDDARDPADPAYDFAATDALVRRASVLGIPVVLSIVHTPTWAGGGRKHTTSPKRLADLEAYSYAIATRYSGRFTPEGDESPLPRVTRWTAWNEPNTTAHLAPQFVCKRGRGFFCKGGTFVPTSPGLYVGIANAIYRGVKAAGTDAGLTETVAAGVTKPVGGGPTAFEPSIAPLRFIKLLGKRVHMDVWAHHPYKPAKKATGDFVGIDDLGRLTSTLDAVNRPKRYPIWLTEYGVQTNPPDPYLGVSPAKQAAALRHAVAVARRNPRVGMLIWFLIDDEAIGGRRFAAGFQTGLAYENGRPKPSWNVFKSLVP